MVSQQALEFWKKSLGVLGVTNTPVAHIVLGSGFGAALSQGQAPAAWTALGEIPFTQIPDFPASTVPDHAGVYRFYRKDSDGRVICLQAGRLHGYEGHAPRKVASTVLLPRLSGIKHFLLTNAAGGLGKGYKPGDIMLISDHVNLTGRNPLEGENPKNLEGHELGPRFPDLSRAYSISLRQKLHQQLGQQGLTLHEGIYLGVLGPSFETPAEVKLFQAWGMGSVGMSTVWEAIALAHSGAELAGLSLISNLGAGLSPEVLDHLKILATSRAAATKVVSGVFAWAAEL